MFVCMYACMYVIDVCMYVHMYVIEKMHPTGDVPRRSAALALFDFCPRAARTYMSGYRSAVYVPKVLSTERNVSATQPYKRMHAYALRNMNYTCLLVALRKLYWARLNGNTLMAYLTQIVAPEGYIAQFP